MKNQGQRIVLFALVVGLSLLPGGLGAQGQTPAVGDPAPDFQLTCLDGNTHSLSDYKGKIIVLCETDFITADKAADITSQLVKLPFRFHPD